MDPAEASRDAKTARTEDPSHVRGLGKITVLLIAVVVLMLMARKSDAASLGTLTFFAKSEVAGSVLKVDDVARLEGVSDQQLRERIRDIELGRAPTPTQAKTLSRPMVESALRQAGVLDSLRVRFPAKMTVVRPGRRLSADEAEELIYESIEALVERTSGDGNVSRVQRSRWSKSLLLPLGELEVVASTRDESPASGLTSFKLDFVVDGLVATSERFSANVSVTGVTCILAVGVERDEVLTRQQLDESTGPASKGGLGCDEAAGQSARTALRQGTVLRASQVKAPTLIERGQPVSIIYELRGLRVRAKGQANQAGALGEWISVVNVSSKKVLRARVDSADTVLIN